MEVCTNIKRFRELKNLSREYIAAELDMSVSGYSKIERGEVDLTISRIKQIAGVLEVDVGLLFRFDVSGVLDSDANRLVQGAVAIDSNMVYVQKYIGMLEAEIERLRGGKPDKD